MRRIRAALLVGALANVPLCWAHEAQSEPALSDYTVTSWTTKDGLTSSIIWALAQDRDGYLWLGTSGGLARFDGARFETISSLGGTSIPKASVRSVFISQDGSFWIGFSTGDISQFHDGHLRTYTSSEAGTTGIITAFAEDHAGTMWIGTATGLLVFQNNRWKKVGSEMGLRATRINSVYVDRHGDLFVGSDFGIFRRRPGGSFERADPSSDTPTFLGFAEDRAGRIWISDPIVGFRQLGKSRVTPNAKDMARGNFILYDRQGYLWVATMGQGIWRAAIGSNSPPEKLAVFGPRSMIEDREGNIWAGTGESLVRLSKPRVKPISNLGLVMAVDTTPNRDVWVSTVDSVLRFPAGDSSRAIKVLSHASRITALHAEPSGAVWIGSEENLIRFIHGRTTKWRLAQYGLGRITAITSDSRGRLWVADRDLGLFRWTMTAGDPRIERVTDQPGIVYVFADSRNRAWFDASDGHLGVVESDGHIRQYSSKDGLGGGPYRSTFEDHLGNIWIGGFDGLYIFQGGRFVRIRELAQTRRTVSAIAEDNDGDLWLTTGSGLGFIRRGDLDSALANPEKQVGQVLFDTGDGLAGMPIWFNSQSVVRAADGKLWWVTGRGVTVLNPHSLKIPQPPARVTIDGVFLNERPLPAGFAPNFSSGANRLQIDYGALQLSPAHPIQFRYRLEGFDNDWIIADTHRQAVYTRLSPRHYRFRVVASNSDGSWSDVAAILDFSIQPAFYQTKLFVGLCLISVCGIIWAFWSLHARRIRKQFAVLLAERVRLSRELHDTLLQSLVGVALQFDAASSSFHPSLPAHKHLVRIRKQVEEYIREARLSIWNLRSSMLENQDLPTALRESVARATDGPALQSRLVVHGTPYHASATIEQQLLRIGQEAILNAMRHSRASQLDVELSYESEAIKLRVADDGCGFDPARSSDDLSGHFGLITMHERAEQAGGRLILKSRIDGGTVIEAEFPSSAAS